MSERFVRMVGFGLVSSNNDGGVYRQAIFIDEKTGAKAEYLVSKEERPLIWNDIERMEQGESIAAYKGYVTQINNVDAVVFEDDDLEDDFKQKKKQLNINKKISYSEAEKIRIETTGYKTNLTLEGLLEIAWRPIDSNANMICFRTYKGDGVFNWSNWFEIVQS